MKTVRICTLSERRSESGASVSVVIFDARPEEERILLSKFLQRSNARMPAAAKAAVKKKKAAPKPSPDKIRDSLLVEVKDPYLPDDSEIHDSVIE